MAAIYYQGSDIKQKIRAKDRNGSYIDIDNLIDFIILVISNNRRTVHARFNKSGGGGYTAIERVDAFTYKFAIDSSITETFPKGNGYYQVKLISNELNAISRKLVFEMRESVT